MTTQQHSVADALMLIAPGCPHCAAVLDNLATLVKEGAIGRLEVVNIALRPERAPELGVRSVPWVRLGDLELSGAHTLGELRQWAERATAPDGLSVYFDHLLVTGSRHQVESMVRTQPSRLRALVELVADPDTGINARVGVGAVFESLADSGLLGTVVPALGTLTDAEDPRVRADACHFLGLTASPEAIPYLLARRDDENADVRDIVGESLALLHHGQ